MAGGKLSGLTAVRLSFADVSIMRELYLAAENLPADGCIIVTNAPHFLRRAFRLAGLRHPRLVIQ